MAQPRTCTRRYVCNKCIGDTDDWKGCEFSPKYGACERCLARGWMSDCEPGIEIKVPSEPATTENVYGGQTRRASPSDDAGMATDIQSSTGPGVPVSGGTGKNDAGGQEARGLSGTAVSANKGRHQEGKATPVADDEFHAEFNTRILDVGDRRRIDVKLMTLEEMEKEFEGL